MENPWTVVDQFFQMYHLPQARICLKDWLDDALRAEDNDAPSHVNTYDMVERLIEAAFILYTDYESSEDQQHLPIDSNFTPALADVKSVPHQTFEGNRFVKGRLLINHGQKVPETFIKEVFRLVEPEDLKAGLHSWIKVNLSHGQLHHMEAMTKSNPIEFRDNLFRLIEALYLISEIRDLLEAIGREELSFGLKEDLRKDRSFAHLTHAQISNPSSVLADFFEKFSMEYCKTELWSLLDAAITYKEQLSDDSYKANLLLYYECYASIIEIGWIIHSANKHKQEEPSDTDDPQTSEE